MGSKIIALSGTHGTGKTTDMLALAAEYKKAHPTLNIGTLSETARDCPFPISEAATPEAQTWIFTTQIAKELEAAAKHDLVIADRTILDVVAYTLVSGFDDLFVAQVQMARVHMPIYKTVYLKQIADNDWCADDGVRSLDADFRQKVENTLRCLYRWFYPRPDNSRYMEI